MPRPPNLSSPLDRRTSPAAIHPTSAVAALVGITLGTLLSALSVRFQQTFLGVSYVGTLVVVASLFAIILGVRLPRRLTIGLAALAWKRNETPSPNDLRAPRQPDHALLWAVTAAAAMAAGLSVAALGFTVNLAQSLYQYAQQHFFWIPTTDALLIVALITACTLIPMTFVGVVLTCLNQFDLSGDRTALPRAPWLLFGTAAGLLAVHPLIDGGLKPDLPVVLAALPLLLAAILSVQQTNRTVAPHPPHDECSVNELARNLVLLRCATTVSSAASVTAVALWLPVLDSLSPTALPPRVILAALIACAAAGALTGTLGQLPEARLALRLARRSAVAGVATIATAVAAPQALPAAAATIFLIARFQTLAYRCARGCTAPAGRTSTPLLAESLTAPAVAIITLTLFAPGVAECRTLLIAIGLTLSALGASIVLQDTDQSLTARIGRASALVAAALGLTAFLPATSHPTDPSAHDDTAHMLVAEASTAKPSTPAD